MVQKRDEYNKFKSSIQHLQDNRTHKITNSLGVYDAYKFIRKNKWLSIPRGLTEHEFYQIIRRINNYLADELISGNDVIFPNRMGKLELRKRNSLPIIDKNGKLKVTYAIDWDKTLKLWFEDEEAYNKRQLVKISEREIFRIRYSKEDANYKNKSFIEFQVNRDIKVRLKQKIKNNEIEAFSYGNRKK